MVADIHVHSSFSTDSDSSMEEQIERAVAIGLPLVCFTDHIDWDYPVEDLIFDFDRRAYFAEITRLRKKYAGRIRILGGVELGLQPHLKSRYQTLLKETPFDFVIGSQHLVNGMDPWYPETFEGRSASEIYRAYFEDTLDGLKAFHEFDSMGHLDYIVRYGPKNEAAYSYKAYADIIDEILKMLIRCNIALELNTCGLRKQLGAPNPHPDILKRYHDLGGTLVTVGSDAHRPAQLGYAFDRVKGILKSCGFTHYVYFERREPKFVLL